MQRQTIVRLSSGIFALLAVSIIGRNLWRRHLRQELVNATQRKDEATVKRLLFRGIPPDAGIARGRTRPIHIAVNKQQKSALISLITFKADINAPDEQGRTPLFLALATLPDPLLEKMLGFGAAPNATNEDNESCLTRAAFLGRRAAIPLLVAHGAEVDVRGRNGETPLIAALRGVLVTGNLGFYPINAPFTADHFGAAVELLKAGADPDATDSFGMTPLMQAAISAPREQNSRPLLHRPPDAVSCGKLLLDKGAKVDARMLSRIDSEGRTALMLAANSGNVELIALLLKHGADPRLRSNSGKTARDYALRSLAKTPRALPEFSPPQPQSVAYRAQAFPRLKTNRYNRLAATIALLDKAAKR